jgi:hypothetical protein
VAVNPQVRRTLIVTAVLVALSSTLLFLMSGYATISSQFLTLNAWGIVSGVMSQKFCRHTPWTGLDRCNDPQPRGVSDTGDRDLACVQEPAVSRRDVHDHWLVRVLSGMSLSSCSRPVTDRNPVNRGRVAASSIALFLATCIAYVLHVLFLSSLVPLAADTAINLVVMPAAFGVVSILTLGVAPSRLAIVAVLAVAIPIALGGPGDPAKPGLDLLGSIIMALVSVSAAAIVGFVWNWKKQRRQAANGN